MAAGENKMLQLKRLSWNRAPAWWKRPYPILARLALVGVVSMLLSELVPIPVAVLYLVLGFLEKDSLQTAAFYPFFMIMQMSNPPRLISSVTWDALKSMAIPVFGMLIIGAIGLSAFGLVAGRMLKIPWRMSISIALCAMIGYPPTLLVSEGAVATLKCSDEEKSVARDYVLPKMLIGGFTSVSILSIFVASIITPMIFS